MQVMLSLGVFGGSQATAALPASQGLALDSCDNRYKTCLLPRATFLTPAVLPVPWLPGWRSVPMYQAEWWVALQSAHVL